MLEYKLRLEAITRNFIDQSWVFILLLAVILILGVSRILFQRNYASLRSLAVFQDNQENFFPFAFMTHVVLIVLIGLILLPFIDISTDFLSENNVINLFGILVFWFLFRFFINLLLIYLLQMKDYFREIINTQVYFRFFAVFILLLAVLLLYYSSISNQIILVVSLASIGLMLVLEYVFQWRKIGSGWISHSYYFILYLCMLEILPILYIFKHWN